MKFFTPILFIFTICAARSKIDPESVNEPNVKGPYITNKATQLVFEYLVHSLDQNKKFKAPMQIEVTNIKCVRGVGNPKKTNCTAEFEIDGKKVEKKIINSTEFFKYLDYHYAINVSKVMTGGTHYKTTYLSCRYSLNYAPYYFCSGNGDVSF